MSCRPACCPQGKTGQGGHAVRAKSCGAQARLADRRHRCRAGLGRECLPRQSRMSAGAVEPPFECGDRARLGRGGPANLRPAAGRRHRRGLLRRRELHPDRANVRVLEDPGGLACSVAPRSLPERGALRRRALTACGGGRAACGGGCGPGGPALPGPPAASQVPAHAEELSPAERVPRAVHGGAGLGQRRRDRGPARGKASRRSPITGLPPALPAGGCVTVRVRDARPTPTRCSPAREAAAALLD